MTGRGRVGELVARLTEARGCDEARDALRRTRGDASLDLGFRQQDTGRYTNAEGLEVELPGPGEDRGSVFVELEGEAQPVAVIVYDELLMWPRATGPLAAGPSRRSVSELALPCCEPVRPVREAGRPADRGQAPVVTDAEAADRPVARVERVQEAAAPRQRHVDRPRAGRPCPPSASSSSSSPSQAIR
jgi:hypothetical protein